MSHFARKVLRPNLPAGFECGGTVNNSTPYVVGESPCSCNLGTRDYRIDARGATDPEAVAAAVRNAIKASQEKIRPSLRLRVWFRGTPEEHRAGRRGWLPVLVAGTAWDEEQLRTQYKARGLCTFWLKVGLDKDAA
jgi:hypothetical protein